MSSKPVFYLGYFLFNCWLTPVPSAYGQIPEIDTPTDVHVTFPTPQAALDWARAASPRMAAQLGTAELTVLPSSDPRVPVLQGYVHQLWGAFRHLFPDETNGLNEPPVVLVESEAANAFVSQYLLQPKKIAHAVVVLTGLINAVGGVDQRDTISSIIGHELAHSVFKHALAEYQKPVNKFYVATKARLGFQAPRAPDLNEAMASWRQGAMISGDLSFPQLLSLPSPGVGAPFAGRVWRQMMLDFSDGSPICLAANQALNEWSDLIHFSSLDAKYSVATSDLPLLADRGQRVIEDENACIGGKRKPFLDLLSEVYRIPVSELAADEGLNRLADRFDSAATPLDGLRAVVAEGRGRMRAVERKVDLSSLGLFTYEEHADDISLIVQRYLGWNTRSIIHFQLSMMPEGDRAKCETLIAQGRMPAIGSFSDDHRATCYRISHLADLDRLVDNWKKPIESFAAEYVRQTVGEEN